MRVLLVNKFFHRYGGPETQMFRHADLLRRDGHEVAFFSMHHSRNEESEWSRYFVSSIELSGPGKPRDLRGRLRAAMRFLYSGEAARKIGALVRDWRPDVAICYNIYHQLSPSILPVLRRAGVRTLLTLRDYKLICPNYTLMTWDGLCERCLGGKYWNSVRHKCVGGSTVESTLCACEGWLHRMLRLYRNADVLVSPSNFLFGRLAADGFYARMPMARLVNAIDMGPRPTHCSGGYVLYVGRLGWEKGLEVLIGAAATLREHRFVLAGRGPQEPKLRKLAQQLGAGNVEFAGQLGGEDLRVAYAGAACLVMPSTWYENCPNVLIEAGKYGKPAVVSNIGGMVELVDDGITGLHFRVGDAEDLAGKLSCLLTDPDLQEGMGRKAREKAEAEWTIERHFERLLALCRGEGDPGVRPDDIVRWRGD